MTPPRRPRGEKPATTIRILQRQLANHQHVINQQRLAIADKERVIAGYDVQLSEALDQAADAASTATGREIEIDRLHHQIMRGAKRLAYLEGYYAKSQETAPHRPIYATSASFPSDQSQTYARQRERDPQDLPSGRQAAEGARRAEGPGRAGEGFSDQIRRQHRDYQADQERSPVEHVEITEASAAYPWPT